MWKDTQRFLLDKVETADLNAISTDLGERVVELSEKVDNMMSIVYAVPRGGRVSAPAGACDVLAALPGTPTPQQETRQQ